MGVCAFGTVAVADKIVSKHRIWNTTFFLLPWVSRTQTKVWSDLTCIFPILYLLLSLESSSKLISAWLSFPVELEKTVVQLILSALLLFLLVPYQRHLPNNCFTPHSFLQFRVHWWVTASLGFSDQGIVTFALLILMQLIQVPETLQWPWNRAAPDYFSLVYAYYRHPAFSHHDCTILC